MGTTVRDFHVTVDQVDPALLDRPEHLRNCLETTVLQQQSGPRPDLVELGELLFELAFPSPGDRERLAGALAEVAMTKEEESLRLWLHTPDPRLASLPWEYLRPPGEAPLALHPRISLVRQPSPSPPEGRIERIGALKLLVAWADPGSGGWPPLRDLLQKQVKAIRNGLRGLPRSHLEVRVVHHATRAKLREEMNAWKPHALHLACHGGVNGLGGVPDDLPGAALVLERDEGEEPRHDYLTAEELRGLCAACGTQVVVMNACWGARTGPRVTGLAQALTETSKTPGVPIVVAMQFEISAPAALGFALSFYGDLAATLPIEDAVASYRRDSVQGALFGAGVPEWGVPVVFQAVRDTALLRAERIDPYPVSFRRLIAQHVPLVGREFVREAFETFQRKRGNGVFLVTAAPGLGKTAFLSQWILDNEETVHFFYRAGAGVTDPDECVLSVYHALLGKYGIVEQESSTDPKQARRKLPQLLETVSARCRATGRPEVILIDALDEAGRAGSDGAEADRVFPEELPEGVYLLASARPGPLADRLGRRADTRRLRIHQRSPKNRADAMLYCKRELDSRLQGSAPDEIVRLAHTLAERAEGNFLVLRNFLDPRSLGTSVTFADVEAAAEHLTGAVEKTYADFLERVQEKIGPGLGEREALQGILGAFATALGPVTRDQLADAFGLSTAALDLVFPLISQFLERGGVREEERGAFTFRLYHETFREFLQERFARDLPEGHRKWAARCGRWKKLKGYERSYALRHLPSHLCEGADRAAEKDPHWARLAAALCDLEFVEAKCAAGMTYELLADYGAALKLLPEAQTERKKERRRQQRLAKWAQDLIACARRELPREELEVIPSVEPWTEAQIQADTERVLTNPTELDRVRAFAQFAAAESHDLVKFAGRFGYVVQQAHNSARSGPVPSAAEALLPRTDAALLLVPARWRPQPNPHPPLLQTLVRHTDQVTSVALTPDGRSRGAMSTTPCGSGTWRLGRRAPSRGTPARSRASPSPRTAAARSRGATTTPCGSGTWRPGRRAPSRGTPARSQASPSPRTAAAPSRGAGTTPCGSGTWRPERRAPSRGTPARSRASPSPRTAAARSRGTGTRPCGSGTWRPGRRAPSGGTPDRSRASP